MTTPAPQTIYCANHPDRETLLRCNRCDKPICTQCAVLTPTGYRCRECVRGQQKSFETAKTQDYILAPLAAAALAFAGSWLVRYAGFFTIFLAPFAGMLIAEAVKALTARRRAKTLFQLTAAGAVLGCLPMLLLQLAAVFLTPRSGINLYALFPLIWQGVYAFMLVSSVYLRMTGLVL